MIELERVYGYYVGGGLASLVLARGLDVLRGAWVVLLSLWLGACVDYSRLADSPHLAALVSPRCTAPFAHPTSALVLLLLLAAFVVRLRALVRYYRALLPVQHYCRTKLHLVDNQLASTPWNSISPLLEPPDPTLLAHRIMRKQNYLIAIFNKSILPLELHCTLLGRRITLGGELTTALEWNLSFCIFGLLLDPSGRLLPAVLIPHHRPTLVEKLRRRFILMGVINLLFSPLIILYLLLYFFLRYFSQYHQNPSTLSTRQFTRLAEWKFREFCELPHLFRERLGRAMPLGDRYLAAWKREKINLGLRFVAFIAGSLATVLVVFSLLDPDAFLHFEITKDRTVFFYIGVFGAILAVSRGMIIDPLAVQERPEELMNQIILHTHYSPASWSNLLHTPFVQGEFSALYKLKIVIFLTEIASVVLTPLILIYEMAEGSGRIVDFFREFTVEVEGVGLVCSFAVFDFGRYGDPRFGGGVARPKVVDEQEAGEGTRKSERVERERERERERARCTEGKMEKSFLNFTAVRLSPPCSSADFDGSAKPHLGPTRSNPIPVPLQDDRIHLSPLIHLCSSSLHLHAATASAATDLAVLWDGVDGDHGSRRELVLCPTGTRQEERLSRSRDGNGDVPRCRRRRGNDNGRFHFPLYRSCPPANRFLLPSTSAADVERTG